MVVLLTLDVEGRVTEAELVGPAGHGFDEEALLVARRLRFEPARAGGAPIAVRIRYTFRFRIPEKETVARTPPPAGAGEPAASPKDARRPATLRVVVLERGHGRPLPGVEVYVLDQDRVYLTDDRGTLELELPPGAYAITIRPPGFYPYHRTERLEEGQVLRVEYYARRHRRDRYRTIVWASDGRVEVSRTSLVDDEIRAVPGTMGDPIRVTTLLPGVTTAASGIGYPIVRGALPGDSLYEVDGIPVPMLYHLLLGNAVLHPRFTDEIIFEPGGYSAEHGRFPGARIAATTARASDEARSAAELSLISTSLFHAQRLGRGVEVVAAARYGTLGYLIEGLASEAVFRYWDYQLRSSVRLGPGHLSATVIGVGDVAGERDPEDGSESTLGVGFHRGDLRWRGALGRGWLAGGAQLGHDYFRFPPEDGDEGLAAATGAAESSLRPYVEGGLPLGGRVELRAGADLLYQDFDLRMGDETPLLLFPDRGLTAGAWAAAELRAGDLRVSPSVRVDHYDYAGGSELASRTAVDPRIAASLALSRRVTLKASGGLFHGPPRFSFVEPPLVFGPVPGLSGLGLEYGLNRSAQVQGGVEAALPLLGLQGMATVFYHDNWTAVDFGLLGKDLEAESTECLPPAPAPVDEQRAMRVPGRAYGAELMLRRRLGEAVFGWVSYSLSRSERTVEGLGTVPADFDQRHVLNTVLSWDVGRNWTLGAVVHVASGRPFTPPVAVGCDGTWQERRGAFNSERLPTYWRLDLRVQKREVFPTWYFDFYIDFFNAAFQWETIDYGIRWDTGEREAEVFPLFLPLIGIRGEF